MNSAIEMGSVAMIYIQSFIKIGSGIKKFMRRGGYTNTYGMEIVHPKYN
jgi:hypothetical protein